METTRFVKHSAGQGIPLVQESKQWLFSAVSAGVGLASSIFGGIKASQAAKEAERRQRKQEAEEQAWYNKRYNEDYVDTAAGQNLVRRAKEMADTNWRKAEGARAVAGGTDAAAQMAKDAGNRMVGDTIANIAAADTQRKDNVDAQHRQAQQQFAQMDMQREQQRAQNITTAAQNASNAIMQGASAFEQASAAKTNLAGGGNNSKVAEQPAASPTITAPNAVTQTAYAAGRTPTDDELAHFRRAVSQ